MVEPSVVPPESLDEEAFPDRFPIDDLLGGGDEADGPGPRRTTMRTRFAAPAQTFEPLGADSFDEVGYDEPGDDLQGRTAEAWDDVVSGQVSGSGDETWTEPAVDPAEQQAADDTADEVLRQMSRLSPKAAEAIAAALNGPNPPTPVSHEAVGRVRSDNDGPVSFMGSF